MTHYYRTYNETSALCWQESTEFLYFKGNDYKVRSSSHFEEMIKRLR